VEEYEEHEVPRPYVSGLIKYAALHWALYLEEPILPCGESCGHDTLWIEWAGTFYADLELDTVCMTCERRGLDHGLLFTVILLVYAV